MPASSVPTPPAGMVPDEQKFEPKSKGLTTPRKKKPKELAVITECCTGCAGSPACVEYCPVEDCMFWVPDEDNPPFGRIQIDPIQCIGCKKSLSKGPDGCFLDGCPWDAIDRKSTRLNSSHLVISYAVFCLKKKKTSQKQANPRLLHPKPHNYQPDTVYLNPPNHVTSPLYLVHHTQESDRDLCTRPRSMTYA